MVCAQPSLIITIKADGSITPSTAHISTTDKTTYNFASGIKGSMKVERSNIIIDGNGYTLQGSYTLQDSRSLNGIYMYCVNNVTLKNTNIANFANDIYLGSSCNNSIYSNNIKSYQRSGIVLDFSSNDNNVYNNTIVNTVSDDSSGILVSGSNRNSIHDNNITNNGYAGIWFVSGPSYNRVYCNNIANNSQGVMLIYSSSNNQFYLNNFISNGGNAVASLYLGKCFNTWDNGTVGNYWSDYNSTDTNRDGIGDTPYIINVAYEPSGLVKEEVNNTDNYPLMEPFNIENNTILPPAHDDLPTTLFTATLAILFVVSVVLLVYFKKRKR